jgi:hypothetical protein
MYVCMHESESDHVWTMFLQPKKAPAPAVVSDAQLCATIDKLVATGDLNTLTKRSLREQLQVNA